MTQLADIDSTPDEREDNQLEELRHAITNQKALGETLGLPIDDYGRPIDEHCQLLDDGDEQPAPGCCAWIYNNLPKMCYYLQWM